MSEMHEYKQASIEKKGKNRMDKYGYLVIFRKTC